MGGLKPIGSEKLQGMDKIHRIMEIARYNENIPNSVNENKSNTYSINLADGNTYSIVKERQGYIIKSTINEGVEDYIEPIRERRYYNSYSQALKRLNLMAKEVNTLHENNSGTSLFGGEKKKLNENSKVYLNIPGVTDKKKEESSQNTTVTTTVPPPAGGTPPPLAGGTPPPLPGGGEMTEQGVPGETPEPAPAEPTPAPAEPTPAPAEPDMGTNSMDIPEPPMDEEPPMDDEGDEKKDEVTFKLLQKLTGKLAQKIRKYNEDEEMSSNDTKYIINSVLSALELDALDEEDIEEIIDRLEGNEDEDFDSEDITDDEMGDELSLEPEAEGMEGDIPPPPPPVESGEMAEEIEFDEIDFENFTKPKKYDRSDMSRAMRVAKDDMRDYFRRDATPGYEEKDSSEWRGHTLPDDTKFRFEDDFEEVDDEPRMWGSRKGRHHSKHLGHLEHGTWGESVVDKTISKYFLKTENEKINKTKKHIKNLSENITQERLSLKFIEKHPGSKMIGKLKNGNLVFESKNIKYKITPKGDII